MNSLVKSLIQPLLEAEGKSIALIPGGFKPPTAGHFYLVNEIAKRSEIGEVLVLIGHKERDGVNKEESLAIWDIYKKYLPPNVTIQIAENPSPVADINSIIKNNPQNFYFPVVGVRGEEDMKDIKRFDSMKGKYDNFKPIVLQGDQGVSGTKARISLSSGNYEDFQRYLPVELNIEDRKQIWNILSSTPINEDYAEPDHFSYPVMLKSLTQYMLDNGMNIEPLPKVQIIDNDVENAKNFFGKTAYYNPNNRLIVLYTCNRHPKDVMRSFAHEMIHHIQNMEDRLGNITTDNTNEEGDLPEIEREAYEKGNMTFRNWTDAVYKSPLHEILIQEGKYDKITNVISSDIFQRWKTAFESGEDMANLKKNYKALNLKIRLNANLDFVKGLDKLNVDGGVNPYTGYLKIEFQVDPELLPQYWEEISMNLKDVIRHEIEHITHGEGKSATPSKTLPNDQFLRDMINMELLPKADYFKLEKEIEANLQGMYLRAKKEKRSFRDVIDDYLDSQDITPEEKEEILDIWRSKLPVLNLPKF